MFFLLCLLAKRAALTAHGKRRAEARLAVARRDGAAIAQQRVQ
jgi:hypothetical protein